jgi:NADH-quinone oxidoreductase subunit A
MNQYFGLILLFALCSGFIITMLALASILGPKNKTVTKQNPFECGSIPVGDVRSHRFNVRFYLVAMLFILFDIEVIFLYPWALTLKELGWQSFAVMMPFILVLVVGFIYEWKKGLLNWND